MSSHALQTLFPEVKRSERRRAPRPRRRGTARNSQNRVDAFLARLARMSTEERVEASRRGEFTRWERSVWSSHHPDEVPLVNGEFEWITLASTDLD